MEKKSKKKCTIVIILVVFFLLIISLFPSSLKCKENKTMKRLDSNLNGQLRPLPSSCGKCLPRIS